MADYWLLLNYRPGGSFMGFEFSITLLRISVLIKVLRIAKLAIGQFKKPGFSSWKSIQILSKILDEWDSKTRFLDVKLIVSSSKSQICRQKNGQHGLNHADLLLPATKPNISNTNAPAAAPMYSHKPHKTQDRFG